MSYRIFDQPVVKDRDAVRPDLRLHADHFAHYREEAPPKEKKRAAPAFKLPEGTAAYQTDEQMVINDLNNATQAAMADQDHTPHTNAAREKIGISNVQKKYENEITKGIEEKQQEFGAAFDPTYAKSVQADLNRGDVNYKNRKEILDEYGSLMGEKEYRLFNPDRHIQKYIQDSPVQDVENVHTVDNQGNVVTNKERVRGKFLVQGSQAQVLDGSGKLVPKKDEDGNPVFLARSPVNSEELVPNAENFWSSQGKYKTLAQKQLIEQNAKEAEAAWIKAKPSIVPSDPGSSFDEESAKHTFLDAWSEGRLVKKTAEDMYNANRAYKTGIETIKRTPKPERATQGENDNKWDLFDSGPDAKDYNTISKGPKGTVTTPATSYGSVFIKNKNGKKPTITINEQTAKNEGNGGYENLIEGTEATLDNIRGGVWRTEGGNTTKVVIPKGTNINKYLRSLTPEDVVRKNITVSPTAYVTAKGTSGSGDIGLNSSELTRYNELKDKFKYGAPVLDPSNENYDQKEAEDYNEFNELGTQKAQKNKTYSLPYSSIQGQVGQMIGHKNATPEAIMSRSSGKTEYDEGRRIIEEKRREYQSGHKGQPNTQKKTIKGF